MTAVAGATSNQLGEQLAEFGSPEAEPAKRRLREPLLVLVAAGFICAHEKDYIITLGQQIARGLHGHDPRVVLVSHSAQANTVKRVFREIMAQFGARPHEVPVHALAYNNDVLFSHRPINSMPPLLEAGTENECAWMSNSPLDFLEFCRSQAPDVLVLAETISEIEPIQKLSASFFGTLRRQHAAFIWPDTDDGSVGCLKDMHERIGVGLRQNAELTTI